MSCCDLFLCGAATFNARACAAFQEGLISVPTDFFQSSLALGSLIQVRQADRAAPLAIHMSTLMPWCRQHLTAHQYCDGCCYRGIIGSAVNSVTAEFVPGGLLQGVLGEKALQGSNVMVHPFLVAGWAGLVSTSLNLLPVGSIDGGRIVQVRCQLGTRQSP